MIATEPRKYSKYNGYVTVETEAFCDICFSNPLPRLPCRGLYLAKEAAHVPCLSLFLFSFFEHFHFQIFFSCSHIRNQRCLKLAGSLSLSFPLSLETRASWKCSHKRRNTEKSTRKITRNVIREATSALLLNRVLRHSAVFSLRLTSLKSCSFYRRSNGTELEIERFHWDKSRSELSLLRAYFDAFISSTMIAKCEYEERCYITYEILK